MTELAEIRVALAAAFANLPGLNPGDKLRTFAYIVDPMPLPCAVVLGPDMEFDETFGNGLDSYEMKVVVYGGLLAYEPGQKMIDTYLAPSGPSSLYAALLDDPTLGGVVKHAWLHKSINSGEYQISGQRLYGREFDITVYAEGD